jgi:hypothetical protein
MIDDSKARRLEPELEGTIMNSVSIAQQPKLTLKEL